MSTQLTQAEIKNLYELSETAREAANAGAALPWEEAVAIRDER